MTSSLIISTYNWPEALELVLMSINNQVFLSDEVIIADDGSKEITKDLIEKFASNFPVPLHHIWQQDDGFKKAHILNKAIASAKGEYIIQADGDCILHPYFIKDHLDFAKENRYLFGSRVNIKKEHLSQLMRSKNIDFNIFSKGIKKRTRAMHSQFLSKLYRERVEFSDKFRGCNVSFFKSDFIAVNGYNEDITGWGREDSELVLRFHNNNLMVQRLRYRGIVFHIFHEEKSRGRFEINDGIEQKTISEKQIWTKNGVDKYLI